MSNQTKGNHENTQKNQAGRNPGANRGWDVNLKTGTIEDLKRLVAAQDDDADHHVVWVSFDGEVHIDRSEKFRANKPNLELDRYRKPGIFEFEREEFERQAKHRREYIERSKNSGKFMFQIETLCCGNDYVGPSAAKDKKWMTKLHEWLLDEYNKRSVGNVRYPEQEVIE